MKIHTMHAYTYTSRIFAHINICRQACKNVDRYKWKYRYIYIYRYRYMCIYSNSHRYIRCTCLNSAVKSTVKCAAATAVAMGAGSEREGEA